MRNLIIRNVSSTPRALSIVTESWTRHPLRTKKVDKNLRATIISLVCGDDFGVRWNTYPEIELVVPSQNQFEESRLYAYLIHELAHVVDRHDPNFTLGDSPDQITDAIDSLPQRGVNASVRSAFITFWNAYIDGRLERRGIVVLAFEERVEEKQGFRRSFGGPCPKAEIEALRTTWNSENLTFLDLVELAWHHPQRRPWKFRLTYPDKTHGV